MANNDKKQKDLIEANRFFENLSDFIADSEGMSNEELKSELKNDGINTEALITRVKSIVDKELSKERLSWQTNAAANRESFLNKMAATTSALSLSKAQLMEKIKSFVSGSDVALAYRNLDLEGMNEEELSDVLRELNILDEFDKDKKE